MNSKKLRTDKIIDILKLHNGETVKDMAVQLGVSEMTIRRDLNTLADKNLIKLVHGAAIYNPALSELNDGYLLTLEEDRRIDEKKRIALKAVSLIEEDDAISIDVGSTTELVAKFMPKELSTTVLCTSLNALLELRHRKGCQIIFPGGYFHENTQMFESPEAVDLIKRTRTQKAFISAAGVSFDLGVTCVYRYEVLMKQAFISSTQTRILLADSSKFGEVKTSFFSNLSDFEVIITDDNLPEETRQKILDQGITLHLV